MKANYQYSVAPKLDLDAFLIAKATGWEDFSLLPGEANIFFEGTFVGKTFIDPNSIKDTLSISLGRDKRSGSRRRTEMPLDVVDLAAAVDSEEILTLEEAIRRLEEEDPSAAKVVQLRFYAGLSVDETADALGISASTVDREWAFARAWLRRAIDSP